MTGTDDQILGVMHNASFFKLMSLSQNGKSKSEARNPKQTTNSNDQNPEQEAPRNKFAFIVSI
jgi:hypothetical protein